MAGLLQEIDGVLSHQSQDQASRLVGLISSVETRSLPDLLGSLPVLLAFVNAPNSRRHKNTLLSSLKLLHIVLSLITSQSNGGPNSGLLSDFQSQILSTINSLIFAPDDETQSAGLVVFATVYPSFFWNLAHKPIERDWETILALKTHALQAFRSGSIILRTVGLAVIRRIIQVQIEGKAADPRRQAQAQNNANIVNLSIVRPNHPFLRKNTLLNESMQLQAELVSILFNSPSGNSVQITGEIHPIFVGTIITTLCLLAKARAEIVQLVVTALVNWSPDQLDVAYKKPVSYMQRKSVEKALRSGLVGLLKVPHCQQYIAKITEYLNLQVSRMESASSLLSKQKREREILSARQDPEKRRKLDSEGKSDVDLLIQAARTVVGNEVVMQDISGLAQEKAVELLIMALNKADPRLLDERVSRIKQILKNSAPAPAPVAQDPLALDLGSEELEMKPEVPEFQAEESDDEVELENKPKEEEKAMELTGKQDEAALEGLKVQLVIDSLRRICMSGTEESIEPGLFGKLVVRMATRSTTDDSLAANLRQVIYEHIAQDPKSNIDLIRLWLCEEWYNALVNSEEPAAYRKYAPMVLEVLIPNVDNKDRGFTGFLLDLPELERNAVDLVGGMCVRADQVQIGFITLRELALLRPKSRSAALDNLLGLASHSDKLTRNAAINTLKRWVPDTTTLSDKICEYSQVLFGRLGDDWSVKKEEEADNMDLDSEEEGNAPIAVVKKKSNRVQVEDGVIIDGLVEPSSLTQILGYVELLFALSVRKPELLKYVFDWYPRLNMTIQESLQALITPVIRSLGPTNESLAELIRNSPPGSEDLVLRIITILMDKSTRLPGLLASAVKDLVESRSGEVNIQFIILVISEFKKESLVKYLPGIIATLNGTQEMKQKIRSIFLSVIAAPSQQFGSSMNAPGTRVGELLTPVELLVLLHQKEGEIGLKQTIEGISICFSMPDAFRQEVWVGFMSYVLDGELPLLFLRTVIQALTQFPNLSAYISTTLLTKLIAKEIWKTPPLWEGFIRIAKATAPNSFASLMGLPVDQFAKIVQREESLKTGLYSFLQKKNSEKYYEYFQLVEE